MTDNLTQELARLNELISIDYDAPFDDNLVESVELANKLHALLVQAEAALRTCRLFAGCEREYDELAVEEALTAIRDAGIGGNL